MHSAGSVTDQRVARIEQLLTGRDPAHGLNPGFQVGAIPPDVGNGRADGIAARSAATPGDW